MAKTTFLSGGGKGRTAWQRGGALGASSSEARLGTLEVLVGVGAVFSIITSAFSPSQ